MSVDSAGRECRMDQRNLESEAQHSPLLFFPVEIQGAEVDNGAIQTPFPLHCQGWIGDLLALVQP